MAPFRLATALADAQCAEEAETVPFSGGEQDSRLTVAFDVVPAA